MKKELLLAIVLGACLGFGITGFVWLKKTGRLNFKNNSDQQETQVSPSPIPNDNQDSKISLEINQPENESILDQEEVTLKGKTLPLATVVVVWEEGEDILIADKEGLFETEITLVAAGNEIEITSYDEQGQEASQILTLTYSTAEI
ncbi:MAG: hypothetical protein ABID04_00600 [Patescibacteria group bacterium]